MVIRVADDGRWRDILQEGRSHDGYALMEALMEAVEVERSASSGQASKNALAGTSQLAPKPWKVQTVAALSKTPRKRSRERVVEDAGSPARTPR